MQNFARLGRLALSELGHGKFRWVRSETDMVKTGAGIIKILGGGHAPPENFETIAENSPVLIILLNLYLKIGNNGAEGVVLENFGIFW